MAFPQDGLTYGTLISLSNVCVRAITRQHGDAQRSPSPLVTSTPSKPAETPSPTPAAAGTTRSREASSSSERATMLMDRKRLTLVMEQALMVLLGQSLLFFSDPR